MAWWSKKITSIIKKQLLLFKKARYSNQQHIKNQTSRDSRKPLEPFEIEPLNKDQLKNLIHKKISFAFFYIGTKPNQTNKETTALLQKAAFVTEEEVLFRLKEQNKSQPVVLICAQGHQSAHLAKTLSKKGFLNACFLKDGLESL